MNVSDISNDNMCNSDNEFKNKVKTTNIRTMNLREKARKSYKEEDISDDDENDYDDESDDESMLYNDHIRSKNQNNNNRNIGGRMGINSMMNNGLLGKNISGICGGGVSGGLLGIKEDDKLLIINKTKEDEEIDEETMMDDQYLGIFNPEVEQILWRRYKKDENMNTDTNTNTDTNMNIDTNNSNNNTIAQKEPNKKVEYLIKFKDLSYLHLKWMEENELLSLSNHMKLKVSRFNKNFEKKLSEMDEDTINESCFFDPTYIEIDRIVYTTDLFSILHPKKANEVKGKWTELLAIIALKLLNFSKDNIHYGTFFMEPIDPERDGLPNYKKIIMQPMDLGTLLNRVYLDYYKTSQSFWSDLGLVFKNCRKYYKDSTNEIRRVCDTLREVAIELYKQWHNQTSEKHQKLIQDYQDKQALKRKDPINKIDDSMELRKPPQPPQPHQQPQQLQQPQQQPQQPELNPPKNRLSDLQNLVLQFENFLNKNNMTLNPYRDAHKFKTQIKEFILTHPHLFKNRVNIDEIAHIIITFSANSTLRNNLAYANSTIPNNNSNNNIDNKSMSNDPKSGTAISISSGNCGIATGINSSSIIENNPINNANHNITQDMQSSSCIVNLRYEQYLGMQEIEQWNPGTYNYDWLVDDKGTIDDNQRVYLTDEDIKDIDLIKEIDRLYLVKWKNLSYLDSSWEHESLISAPHKINDFKYFNRALDRESRIQMTHQVNLHKAYLDYINNPRKYAKFTSNHIQDLKNKLYYYNISSYQKIFQYNINNQPIFKDRKLLRDYQLESLNWLIQAWYNQRNVILADEMGLGKTIQSIAFLNHLYNFEGCKGPFLVLAPLSTLEHWRRTVDEWTNLNGILYYDINSVDGRACCRSYEWFYIDVSTKGTILQSSELHKFQILITSYEVFLQDLTTIFLDIPFQFIIVDEAHRLKNANARILSSLKKLPCKRILLLTGTPIQNNTEELWSLLNYIEPEKFSSIKEFLREFGDLSNADQIEKLHKVLKPFILRRKKEDVEASIPPLQETIIDVEMTTTQKTIYRALYERNKTLLSKGLNGTSTTNLNTSLNNLEMQLRKCCNHPFLLTGIETELTKDAKSHEEKIKKLIESSGKMILLDKLLPKLKNEGKKVLIFSQFTYMLAILEDYLYFRGYKYEKIDGAVKSKERQNAIDRFNDPTKKRDIFLLSTKAGGLGINLTSANIVIIFDSDWNPQNDVQAAARAHRIGQQMEVQVYRLITSNTYESEMFERASKKLGLDQAIFMGGTFQSTNDNLDSRSLNQLDENSNPKKGINKQEIETLLKKGILGLLNDDSNNKESQKFMEEDIDEILKKNTHIAKYSLINGTYTFSKSSFISEKADVNININDPNFWELILKNSESTTKTLLIELDEKKDIFKDIEEQKKYMDKIFDSIYKVIENKVNVVSFNADDEKNVMDILNKISTSRYFHKVYRDIALNWIYELAKPSRKIKRTTIPLPTEINQEPPKQKKATRETRSTTALKKQEKGGDEGSDVISIFNEGDDDDINDNESISENEDDTEAKKVKKPNKIKDDLLKKLCSYCERAKCTIYCQGICKRSFHSICKQKIESGNICGIDDNKIDYELYELQLDDDKLKLNIDLEYICNDCQSNISICYICKTKGVYNLKQNQKSKPKATIKSQEKEDDTIIISNGSSSDKEAKEKNKDDKEKNKDIDKETCDKSMTMNKMDIELDNNNKISIDKSNEKITNNMTELVKCSTPNCNKFYHLTCINNNPYFKFINAEKHNKFRCSLHYCQKCKISGDNFVSVQCFRCPKAYHIKCMPKEKIIRLTKKSIICQDHESIKGEKGNDSGSNNNSKQDDKHGNKEIKEMLSSNNNSSLKKKKSSKKVEVVKVDSSDDKESAVKKGQTNNTQNDRKKISKNEMISEDDDEEEKEKVSSNKKRTKTSEKVDRKSKEVDQQIKKRIEGVILDTSEDSKMSTEKSNKSKKRVISNIINADTSLISDKSSEDVKEITYAELGIDPPETFNYAGYNDDWCRYCGARYSSKFSKGPWGPKTLCAQHYNEWKENKILTNKSYKEIPLEPIKPDSNIELIYLQELLAKEDKDKISQIFENLKPIKKLKKNNDDVEIIEIN